MHVASLSGVTYPFKRILGILGQGVFIVSLPTIFLMI
jgi:hypothetical protein